MRIIQKTINHFFSLNTYPLSFVIIQQQISADRLLGEKSVSRHSRICKGEKIWNHKVENFFLSVWKKLFVMNGIRGVQARGGERRKGNKAPAWVGFFFFNRFMSSFYKGKKKYSLASFFFFFNYLHRVFMVDAWSGFDAFYDDRCLGQGLTPGECLI